MTKVTSSLPPCRRVCPRCGLPFELPPAAKWRKHCAPCRADIEREHNSGRRLRSRSPLTRRATPQSKRCCDCGAEKPAADFNRASSRADGLASHCRVCEKRRRAEGRSGRPGRRKRTKEQRQAERQRAAERTGRAYRRVLSEAARQRTRIKRERIAKWRRKWRHQLKRQRRIAAKPWSNPSLTASERYRLRYRLDVEFQLKERLRRQATKQRKRLGIAEVVRAALKNGRRSPRVERELGYTIADLREHLEKQFSRRMSWKRFMAGEIHIDHIRPIASFDLADHDQFRACWSIANLQPLWRRANLAKGGRRTLLL